MKNIVVTMAVSLGLLMGASVRADSGLNLRDGAADNQILTGIAATIGGAALTAGVGALVSTGVGLVGSLIGKLLSKGVEPEQAKKMAEGIILDAANNAVLEESVAAAANGLQNDMNLDVSASDYMMMKPAMASGHAPRSLEEVFQNAGVSPDIAQRVAERTRLKLKAFNKVIE
ncbi:MAG: hypothetical protein KC505_06095 [Myxococcales bacterium]|nr:hypothetical protein [Myxococcales bacterium]USN50017.1 MAG: hypothetical protein H6731_07010 [Myxococcales bacterium]